jgi:hypothetical protein
VLVCALGAPERVAAFSLRGDDDGDRSRQFGNVCHVQSNVLSHVDGRGFRSAYLRVVGPAVFENAGGSEYIPYRFTGKRSGAEIRVVTLAYCLTTNIANITDLQQNGADSTFTDDNYIGFKFTLTEAAGGLASGPHEFKIGSGEFPVSNTQPTANAGPDDGVASASTVTLDGSGSDANDEGQSLTVNDGIADSEADTVSITVSDVTPPEVADRDNDNDNDQP